MAIRDETFTSNLFSTLSNSTSHGSSRFATLVLIVLLSGCGPGAQEALDNARTQAEEALNQHANQESATAGGENASENNEAPEPEAGAATPENGDSNTSSDSGNTADTSTDGTDAVTETDSDTDGDNESESSITPDVTDFTPSGEVETPEPEPTALDLIQSDTRLGELAALVRASNFVDYFDAADQRATLFAPTDKAFATLSTNQRAQLLADPDRVGRFLRRHVINEERVTSTTIAALEGQSFHMLDGHWFELLTTGSGIEIEEWRKSQPVVDSLTTPSKVIHLVDDFMTLDPGFFPPDPGSLADVLIRNNEHAFLSQWLPRSRWYGLLGNAERRFTMLVPPSNGPGDVNSNGSSQSGYDLVLSPMLQDHGGDDKGFDTLLANHIIEESTFGGSAFENGDKTALSGLPIRLRQDGTDRRVNDVEVLATDTLSADNGILVQLEYPITGFRADGTLASPESILDVLERQDRARREAYYNCESDARGYRFFADLIRALRMEEAYSDSNAEKTVLIPRWPILREDFSTWESQYQYEYCRNDHSVYGHHYRANYSHQLPERDGDGESTPLAVPFWPTLFESEAAAREFLLSHTLNRKVTASELDENDGATIVSAAGRPLTIERVQVPDSSCGEEWECGTVPETRIDSAAVNQTAGIAINGNIVGLDFSLVSTPDVGYYYGEGEGEGDGEGEGADLGEGSTVYGDHGPVASALLESGEYSDFAVAWDNQIGLAALDDSSNNWTLFAPTNEALVGTGTLDMSRLQASVITYQALSPESLANTTEVTTNDGRARTIVTHGDSVTIDGIPARLLVEGTTVIYGLDGVLP